MKSPATARVLIAAADAGEAAQLVDSLRNHFDHVGSSTDADAAAEQFEKFAPDVIVMAFKALEQAERYYLALHRFGQSVHQRIHRTILLCRKEDAAAAFELCKKRFFDDYVLYWPNPQDGLRIPMSVWIAAREIQAQYKSGPTAKDLRTHARHLEDLDHKLSAELEHSAKRAATANDSLLDLEQELLRVNDDFSHRLVTGGAGGSIEVKDAQALERELERFKRSQLDRARSARDQVVKPMTLWASELKGKVAPVLTGTRALAAQIIQSQPVLLVVDDNEVMRSALQPVLSSLGYELVLVGSGQEALLELTRIEPDAILLDIGLSDTDGITLTRQLKSTARIAQIPVILMSGDSRRDTLVSAMQAGAADFIAKPFTRDILRTKLDKVVRRPIRA
jgi:PleD family two-component response regulator